MALKDALLPEYDHEMGTTRRLLDRVPADFAWKPHDRSRSLGQLAAHLAQIPQWVNAIVDQSSFDIAGAGGEGRTVPETRAEVLADFDRNVAAARQKIAARTDAELMSPWTLTRGEMEMFTVPKIAVVRSFLLNHSIHHRGQLSVYLRLLNVPLPAMYGPTADESGF